jgi:RHS repeat-associated protein
LIEKWFPNGVNTQYTYNRDNTLKQLVNRHGAGITISQHDYTYDGVGNRISQSELINGTTSPYTYAYDGLNRLTTVTNTSSGAVESYAYDPLGNRRTKTAGGTTLAYVYDNANQLTEIHTGSVGGTLVGGLVYDNNGNLTKKCENGTVTVNASTCTGNTVTDLTHDGFNRLAQVTKTGISSETYKYDDQGNRIQKSVGGAITNFLYNGPDVIGQYTSSWGTASAVLTHGPKMDDPIIRTTSTTTQYFHQDGLGSVVSVTNQSGITDGTARFDAWGNKIASTGTIPQYGYTGREPDDTGLVYFRARFYDPTIGRFTQRDPIGMPGGINLYAYVKGNPANFTDPMGLVPKNPTESAVVGSSGDVIVNDTSYVSAIPQGQTSAQQRLYQVDLDENGIPTRIAEVDSVTTRDLAVNGIRQDREAAALSMAAQVRAVDPTVRSFTLFHNPTEGSVADLWEAARDKLGMTTPITREFAGVLQSIQTSGTRITAYSQGGVIVAEAVRVLGGTLPNISSIQCNGCANNEWASNRIFAQAGITNINYTSHVTDAVPNIAGLNTINPIRLIGSLVSTPLLFTNASPHTYP